MPLFKAKPPFAKAQGGSGAEPRLPVPFDERNVEAALVTPNRLVAKARPLSGLKRLALEQAYAPHSTCGRFAVVARREASLLSSM